MQMIRKNRWVIVASLAFAIIFGGVFVAGNKPAYADLYGSIVKDCHYQFVGSNQNTIERSACPNGYADITFNLLDAGKHTYSEKSKVLGCEQFIDVSGSDLGSTAPITGTLYGKYEPKGELSCGDVNLGDGTTEIQVYSVGSAGGDATDDEIKSAAYQVAVYDKLEDLVHKRCKNDSSGTCIQQMVKAVNSCTDETMSSIKDSDTNKNDKFKALFSRCFTTKVHSYNDGSSADITRDKVYAALGDNIYTEVKAAGEAALTKSGDSSDPDSCNASGNPMTWILCPIYDGVASLSDAILNNAIVPLLKTNPISTDPDSTIYKVWSSFRVWGDIMLVIGLIVIVFGQAIGGGVLDAYTAKKALPRLLVAAILINLSLYIVALSVDITNVIGQSIGNIITAPLDGVSLSPSGFKLGFFAAIAAVAGGAATIIAALGFVGGLGGVVGLTEFLPFVWMFVVLPALIAIILVFVTLALRQAIIMALVLLSPVAFALYCLPNTEQYFRKWWDLLFNMLLVYPIVIVIFAVADLLAYTSIISSGSDSFWGYLIAFLLQFVPLLMIPFAFKLAGGVLGRIHEIASGHSKRGVEAYRGDARDPWSRRNLYKRRASNKFLEGRESLIGRGKQWQSGGTTSAFMGRRLSGFAGMGNYEDLRSRRNKEASELVQGHIATGGDDTVRALFATQGADGIWRSATTGKVFEESDVMKARSLYGRDSSMFQAAYHYELGKAANDQELDRAMDAADGLMDELQLPGKDAVFIGAHYGHQQTRRELKHTKRQEVGGKNTTGRYKFRRQAAPFTREVAENVNNWSLGNMRTSTIKGLQEDYKDSVASLATIDPHHRSLQGISQSDIAEYQRDLQAKIAEDPKYLENRGIHDKQTEIIGYVRSTADSLGARGFGSSRAPAMGGESGETPLAGAQTGAAGLVNDEIGKLIKLAANQRPEDPPTTPPTPTPGSPGSLPPGS